MAVGLGTVDMPVPSIAEWEWLNWSFPRQVHAGDTVYARWTLTQKRPPVAGAASSIVVWRVDVHTADGALCAEGEIGAKVKRESRQPGLKPQLASAGVSAAASPAGSRRRRHRSRANGTVPEPPAVTAPPAVAAPPAPAAKPERATGPSRRRRRRRSGGTTAQQEEHEPRAALVADRAPEPPPPSVPAAAPARGSSERGIGRVLKRLRRS